MSFEDVSVFARSWGLVFLMLMFAIAVVYAVWPANRAKFNAAARMPLDEEPKE